MLTKLLHFVRWENEEESHMNLIYEARLWIKLLRQKAEDFKNWKQGSFCLIKLLWWKNIMDSDKKKLIFCVSQMLKKIKTVSLSGKFG